MTASTHQFLKPDFDVIIAGGGLAGLTAAILLSRNNKKVLLIEKKSYPVHKVCGEYVSNEVLSFLLSLGFDPFALGASRISKLRVSTPGGKNIYATLDLGGFGLSRYKMDEALSQLAIKNNATVLTSTRINEITFIDNSFIVKTNSGELFTSKLVIGSYGKRDVLDKKLERSFIKTHTGYMGVKYHIKTAYPADEVGLDNFERGYCGIAKIEEDKYNLCYLYQRQPKNNFDSIKELEEKVLFTNPVIKNIFSNATFLFEQPEVINEISFAPKQLIENHIMMCGDSAGLITPLCGNGMSMAIHAAKLLCDLILKSEVLIKSAITLEERNQLEKNYLQLWNKNFSSRLFWGRTLQHLFGNKLITGLSIHSIHALPKIERWLISKTHGQKVLNY